MNKLSSILHLQSLSEGGTTEEDIILEDVGGEDSELDGEFDDDLEECSGDEDVSGGFSRN